MSSYEIGAQALHVSLASFLVQLLNVGLLCTPQKPKHKLHKQLCLEAQTRCAVYCLGTVAIICSVSSKQDSRHIPSLLCKMWWLKKQYSQLLKTQKNYQLSRGINNSTFG